MISMLCMRIPCPSNQSLRLSFYLALKHHFDSVIDVVYIFILCNKFLMIGNDKCMT